MKNVITLIILFIMPIVAGTVLPAVGEHYSTAYLAGVTQEQPATFRSKYPSGVSQDYPHGFHPAYPSRMNPDHLDGPFTGGFGEQTCHSCHFDYKINMDSGSLRLDGLTGSYRPGKSYDVTVILESDQLENGGFQMTARFRDGSPAGTFEWKGDRLMLTPDIDSDVPYLQHSASGTSPAGERSLEWTFTWHAPDDRAENIVINIAANAGNDDDSSFGDRIYVMERILDANETGAEKGGKTGTGNGIND
jgi:hypothetical protein